MERPEKIVQFGEFELDARTGELRARGNGPVQLAEQPLQILLALLERPGKLVSREELQKRLWEDNTVVEFEHSISAAMNRLRKTLGDSTENPKFIETLARRGYRWKAPVEWRAEPNSNGNPSGAKPGTARTIETKLQPEPGRANAGVFRRHVLATGALIFVAVSVLWFLGNRYSPKTARRPWNQKQLTVNIAENPVTGGAISPDGKYLAYTDLYGMRLKLIASGEEQSVAVPEVYKDQQVNWEIGSWLLDSGHFYAIAEVPLQPSVLWMISVTGGAQQKIATGADPWGVSPDGALLAVTMNDSHEIWLMEPNGENRRRLLTSGDGSRVRAVQWAPNGRGVAYVRNRASNGSNQTQIEFADLQSGTRHVLLSGKDIEDVSRLEEGLQDMTWLPDWRLIFDGGKPDIHGMSCNLWQSRIDLNELRASPPERMTDWSGFCVNNISQTADGKKLVFNRSTDLLSVYVADFDAVKLRITEPHRLTFTEDISSPAGWSPDSKEVLIRSNREGSWGLYRKAFDRNSETSITTGREGMSYWAQVTPDQQWILFKEPTGSEPRSSKLMRVPFEGGAANEVLTGRGFRVGCPRRAEVTCVIGELLPDRNQLAFSALSPIQGRGAELARFADNHAEELEWDLSPDGMQVMLYRPFTKEIVLFSLKEKESRRVEVNEQMHLRNITWTADGKGFFATDALQTGARLIYADLRGNTRLLWTVTGRDVFLAGKASPDGRHVAIQTSAGNSNMWMAENF